MFTGIIEEVGKVGKISRMSGHWQIGVQSDIILPNVTIGGSVAVNGVCLTLVKKERNTIFFDVVKTTLDISNLKSLSIGSHVNLESSLSASDKLEGHFVLGHIDSVVRLRRISKQAHTAILEVESKREFKKYLAEKGSVALDGISLTIATVRSDNFLLNIIPYTIEHTNLKYKKVGSFCNVEFDYLAKAACNYLEHKKR